jgi:hypothetical protein
MKMPVTSTSKTTKIQTRFHNGNPEYSLVTNVPKQFEKQDLAVVAKARFVVI